MYTVDVGVTGTFALMQHRFPVPELSAMTKGGTKRSGAVDYTEEWRQYLYVDSSKEIYQPAVHFESAMVAAAKNFKITGRRGKSYGDIFKANIFVSPDKILHGVKEPSELDEDGDKRLYLDLRPVVVNRARVVRIRPTFKAGWKLEFSIECLDDQIPTDLLRDVLDLAGKTQGVGDNRPRFGRFMVTKFEVHK